MTSDTDKYQSLVGCLFDRQARREFATDNDGESDPVGGVFIISDIRKTGTDYWLKMRFLSSLKEFPCLFSRDYMDFFLNLKTTNNTKYATAHTFAYEYRYIQ